MSTDLRTRIRAGDPSAFGELYDSHARAVYNHAFRLAPDWAAAEDVMAETFMQAWRLRQRIDPEGGSLRPWLLGVATNVARGHYRGNRRYRAAARAAAEAETALPDHAEEVAGRLDDRRRIAAALRALSALRRPEREVLTLCLWEGLEYTAAAEALGIAVGTVRSRLSRARAKLRRLTEAELTGASAAQAPVQAPGQAPGLCSEDRAGTSVRGEREPGRPDRQTRDERNHAIRPVSEGNR
ncbi:RNA polymerase sigma factor [Streptomyces sp. NBC_01310]|uniref:RNA polymerase sigma factor n=1 Tax=Streptomyces sp. NBC_01310 TaxID=2903820 RepID=UPI0035B61BC5|nr:RNA polymerase sigma factor [Streptomyces sp. NBC_01310]WSJ63684.1 RNA polymerase sigma factor [Streptomyces sp. NBC_01310]